MGQRPFSSRCRLPKNGKLIRTVETVKQGDTLGSSKVGVA
jgi:hypothetical protein